MSRNSISIFIKVLLLFALIQPVNAQDRSAQILQSELSICAAYFTVMNECISRDPRQKAEAYERTNRIISILHQRSRALGRAIGMTDDAIKSGFFLSYKSQSILIKNDCSNVASLILRYGERCKVVFETTNN